VSTTIEDRMTQFQKNLWAKDKPIDYCVETVEEMLVELQRVQTVMIEAICQINILWEEHRSASEEQDTLDQLYNLMHCLHGNTHGIYLQHLTPEEREEYTERIKNKTAFPDS